MNVQQERLVDSVADLSAQLATERANHRAELAKLRADVRDLSTRLSDDSGWAAEKRRLMGLVQQHAEVRRPRALGA